MPPGDRDLPHFYIEGGGEAERYVSPRTPRSPAPPQRNRAAHAARLQDEIRSAVTAGLTSLQSDPPDVSPGERGIYLEFAIPRGEEAVLDKLENRPKRIELVSLQAPAEGPRRATVFVPESNSDFFSARVQQYAEQESMEGRPKHEALVARIEGVQLASLGSIFTDEAALFPPEENAIWWEVWLRNGTQAAFVRACAALDVRLREHAIAFPEREVRLALATPAQLQRVMHRSGALAELRIARDTPSFFLHLPPQEEALWIEDLNERFDPPPDDDVAVCVLDSGVVRAHPLLAPLVAPQDLHTCDPAWGVDENPNSGGHGTAMVGLSAYGDLADLLSAPARFQATHCAESVKILPPIGENDPDAYGAITLEGIARAEVQAPHRARAFCLAVTSSYETAGGRPSSWSAALDQGCYNAGDAQRLMIVSAGNIRDEILDGEYLDANDLAEIESPAQAWNVLSVGAYTDKVAITDPAYAGWGAVAPPGGLGPGSRTSLTWRSQWPVKPDIVMEGGNFAHDGSGNQATMLDDLCVLTTYYRPQIGLVRSFGETSAATALASRMAAQILRSDPNLWPETVRALMVHSATWTDEMLDYLGPDSSYSKRRLLLRRCGYGVPSLERALLSATNDLTMVVQDELSPFEREGSQIRTREMHIHRLPWPAAELESLADTPVELRVTLSYFVEPNPGERGWTLRHRYASHGMRFEVKGSLESDTDFRARINRAARDEDYTGGGGTLASDKWFLTSALRNSGSIHSDIWSGTAADLAKRGAVGVYPVGGWWKEKARLMRFERSARYALLVTLRVPDSDIDIYTPVSTQIESAIDVEV